MNPALNINNYTLVLPDNWKVAPRTKSMTHFDWLVDIFGPVIDWAGDYLVLVLKYNSKIIR